MSETTCRVEKGPHKKSERMRHTNQERDIIKQYSSMSQEDRTRYLSF